MEMGFTKDKRVNQTQNRNQIIFSLWTQHQLNIYSSALQCERNNNFWQLSSPIIHSQMAAIPSAHYYQQT